MLYNIISFLILLLLLLSKSILDSLTNVKIGSIVILISYINFIISSIILIRREYDD